MDQLGHQFWQDLHTLLGLGFIILFLFSWVLVRLTLDRRVRKSLPQNKNYNSYMDQWFGVGRAATFAWCAIVPNKKHADVVAYYYNEIDIYTFSNKYEKLFSFGFIGGFFLLLFVTIPVHLVTDYLGIFEWR